MAAPRKTVELKFSNKYSEAHARAYFQKHQTGILRRLSHWREEQVARKALKLSGEPSTVLDLPCGAGRFWPLLKEKKTRTILAADNSAEMLNIARQTHPGTGMENITCLQTSAFEIKLPDASVDCVFCIRLLHHIGHQQNRALVLREFHRVTRDTVIISLWVDGNYKAWRRRQLEKKRGNRLRHCEQNRFVIPRNQIENEFGEEGFEILGHLDFLPFYQMWRTYVLRKR